MTMTKRASRSDLSAGSRHVAVLTVLAFGCATVRVPASTIAGPAPVQGAFAEPQLELWLESGGDVSPAESAQATGEAKAALRSALAGVEAPQGDGILVVRAQGVARTSSRRSEQHAAIAGLVVGAVVIVAAVVAVLVASKGKGFQGGHGGKVAAPPIPRAPRPIAPVPRVARVAPVVRPGHIDVNVFAGIQIPPDGEVSQQGADGSARDAQGTDGSAWDAQGYYEQTFAPAAQPQGIAEVWLAPPSPLAVADRGFFAKDALRLELVVVDRRDGRPLWFKVVEGNVDPRDASAVRRLLEGAIADPKGWTPASAE